MDPLSHALGSYLLKRAAFPRLGRPATVAMVLAGTIADVDLLSAHFGPSAYITWSRTFCHSVLAVLVISFCAAAPFFFLHKGNAEKRIAPRSVFVAALAASLLHVLFDLCQAQGVMMLWPFTNRRFALDWVAHLDLWILGVLLAALLLPKLASLVTEEIGGKSKGPRGRAGAYMALAAIVVYVSARGALHASAVATLESRAYHGESPRHAAAFAESASPFTWNGVVETERALLEVPFSVGPGSSFDPDAARTFYKADPSPALDAALKTRTARRFLAYARFPRASVEKTAEGNRVRLQTYAFDPDFRVQALIEVSPTAQILSETLSYDFGVRQP